MGTFYTYFKENMDGLNLPAPESLFGSLQVALANTIAYMAHIDKFGKGITVREMIGAGTKLERLTVIGSLSAAYYVGAVVGSIAVATGRSAAGGTALSDVLAMASRYRINRPWLMPTFSRFPHLYSPRAVR
ncbi:hypothetical protein HSX11_01780 [Oxalobacteraceae bacterium]|nr:hypothetical protein [Oxalobacteraceae bacterium]